jgi:hypothetical protein
MTIDFTGDPDWRGWPVREGCPLPVLDVEFEPYRLGGTVRGALGGSQRIDRLGDRWQMTFTTGTVEWEPEGRRWASMLSRAEKVGGLFRLPQPSMPNYAAGKPVIRTSTPAGRTIPVSGLYPDALVLEGQWVSVIVAGQRYADRVEAQAVADADGEVDLPIENLLRLPMPAGATVELMDPKIQGTVEVQGGKVATDGTTSWTITVTEDA